MTATTSTAPRTDGRTAFDPVAAVADAVLYEGYLLYPYRRSSGKNKVRWQFGVLLPPRWARAHGLTGTGVAGSEESWWQQTECLLEPGADDAVHVRLRFLQLQRRSVEPAGSVTGDADFDEAVPCEFDVVARLAELLDGSDTADVSVAEATVVEPVSGGAGRLVRRREPVAARVALSAQRCPTPHPLVRLRIRVENTDDGLAADAPRDRALMRALIATHTLVAAGGRFVSLLDPPEWASEAARECRSIHTFPVLAGPEGSASVVLSSPIILYDHPKVAPESPGDLHDATEIDEILTLRTLTLTDEEKAEARRTDPRAAAIVDRVDAMPPEVLERLHGAIRSLRPAATAEAAPTVPWWDPGADASVSPQTDGVVVAGVRIAKGSRVRLRPRRRGTDVHDMFLVGRTARVEAVLLDVDDVWYVAVTVDDDPAAELNEWYGRYRYFTPDEIEPIESAS